MICWCFLLFLISYLLSPTNIKHTSLCLTINYFPSKIHIPMFDCSSLIIIKHTSPCLIILPSQTSYILPHVWLFLPHKHQTFFPMFDYSYRTNNKHTSPCLTILPSQASNILPHVWLFFPHKHQTFFPMFDYSSLTNIKHSSSCFTILTSQTSNILPHVWLLFPTNIKYPHVWLFSPHKQMFYSRSLVCLAIINLCYQANKSGNAFLIYHSKRQPRKPSFFSTYFNSRVLIGFTQSQPRDWSFSRLSPKPSWNAITDSIFHSQSDTN